MGDGGHGRSRERMVAGDLVPRGINDSRVLAAMAGVPREEFVPSELVGSAYSDGPLQIGWGQTISQPYIVALMAQALSVGPDDSALEIGTGSGYGAAVLSRLAKHVWSIERVPELAKVASDRLARLGFDNVEVVCSDGSLGWPQAAPYDVISVAAAGPRVPGSMVGQLAEGGRLVMPIDSKSGQVLIRETRHGDTCHRDRLARVRFVRLIGEGGDALDQIGVAEEDTDGMSVDRNAEG